MCGLTDPAQFKLARKILLIMGEYFQIQDDYLVRPPLLQMLAVYSPFSHARAHPGLLRCS